MVTGLQEWREPRERSTPERFSKGILTEVKKFPRSSPFWHVYRYIYDHRLFCSVWIPVTSPYFWRGVSFSFLRIPSRPSGSRFIGSLPPEHMQGLVQPYGGRPQQETSLGVAPSPHFIQCGSKTLMNVTIPGYDVRCLDGYVGRPPCTRWASERGSGRQSEDRDNRILQSSY